MSLVRTSDQLYKVKVKHNGLRSKGLTLFLCALFGSGGAGTLPVGQVLPLFCCRAASAMAASCESRCGGAHWHPSYSPLGRLLLSVGCCAAPPVQSLLCAVGSGRVPASTLGASSHLCLTTLLLLHYDYAC